MIEAASILSEESSLEIILPDPAAMTELELLKEAAAAVASEKYDAMVVGAVNSTADVIQAVHQSSCIQLFFSNTVFKIREPKPLDPGDKRGIGFFFRPTVW